MLAMLNCLAPGGRLRNFSRRSIIMVSITVALALALIAYVTRSAPRILDESARQRVVLELSEVLRNEYVYPDIGAKAAARISASHAAGQYNGLSDGVAFAAQLSSDLAEITRDKHLKVLWKDLPRQPITGSARPLEQAGISRADKLPGGVGYIEIIGFPRLSAYKPVLDTIMLALKDSRGLIIDVRRNRGGDPESVAYFVSYLMTSTPAREISSIIMRTPGTTAFERVRQYNQPTPITFANRPIYVLTSNNTFSGGEELAYDVQSHKLGKIIGEITRGGANPAGPVNLSDGIMAVIPFGRTEDPITKSNWEGKGVQPDVQVPSTDALKVALQKFGQAPVSGIHDASIEQVFAPRPKRSFWSVVGALVAFTVAVLLLVRLRKRRQ